MNNRLIWIFLFFAINLNALEMKNGKVTLAKIEEYTRCQTMDYGGDFCDAALKEWVAVHPNDMFKAGKLTRASMNAWGAIYFFNKAFLKKSGNCKDNDVWLAVESAFDLPESGYEDVLKQTKSIALKECFREFKSKLVTAVDAGGYAKINLCKDLTKLKAYTKSCE